MTYIFLTDLFKWDLGKLDRVNQNTVVKTIDQLNANHHDPTLQVKDVRNFPRRNIFRARVNQNFQLLGEWLPQGDIRLWRVGSHNFVDAIDDLPFAAGYRWTRWSEREENSAGASSKRQSQEKPRPFKNFPSNILRLFGVPDSQLEAVKYLHDPETIWEFPIPLNVKWTLNDIVNLQENWTADRFLDPKQLLYRTTVDQLRGYCEGEIKRLLLNLTEEQKQFVHIKANGPVLVKGVAGSGKTTIGLYRAHELKRENGSSKRMFAQKNYRVLLLTYTKTLTNAMKQLYEELYGEVPHDVNITTISSWMFRQLNRAGVRLSIAEDSFRHELIRQAQKEITRRYPTDTVVSQRDTEYLLDEIDQVIRARWLKTLAQYKAINRVGRGVGLDRERHRPIVWEIYLRYQQLLDHERLCDWADLPRLVDKFCQPLPQLHGVIIDEAQDLPPSHLLLISQLIPDFREGRSLTLLADPAQSIYYRGIAWKEGGVNVQGSRTRTLDKSFRNSLQILEAARYIAEGFSDLKTAEEYIPPESTDRNGPKPVLAAYKYVRDAKDFVINKTIELCQSGNYRPGDIAILSRTKKQFASWERAFRLASLNLTFFREGSFRILENDAKFITMHSAKGLEFPVVFVINLDDRIMPLIFHSSETKAQDELQERKLFYVSMTRASERLYMLHPQRNPSRFLREIGADAICKIQC